MAEANGGKLMMTDENIAKIRKGLVRNKDGSFQVCATHERRIRADGFEILIETNGTGEMSAQAVAHLTCGHSKNPCKADRRVMLATQNGIESKIAKILAVGNGTTADEDEDEDEGETTEGAAASA